MAPRCSACTSCIERFDVRQSSSDRLAPAYWLAIAAAILWTIWPLVSHAWCCVVDTRALYPDVWRTIEPDIWLQIWILAWGAHILPTDPLALYQANAFAPTANSLARSDHLLGMLPVFAPVWWLTGNPVFAFQLTAIASYLVCGFAMYAMLRHFDCGRPVAAGVAVLWAVMAFRVHDGLARAQLLQYQYLPLIVLFFDRFLERGRRRDLAGAAVFLLLQTMTAYWHAYFAVFTAAATILASAMSRAIRDTKRLASALGVLVAVGAVLVVTSLPYLEMSREGQLVPKALPAKLSWYFASPSFPLVVSVAMIGGLVCGLRAGGRLRRATSLFALIAAAGVSLSLASGAEASSFLERMVALPRDLAVALVPGFRYLRDQYRFLTLASLGIYALAAIGIQAGYAALRERWQPAAPLALAALLLIAAAPLATLQIPVTPALATSEPPPVYAWLAEHGDGGTVLELPISKNLGDAYLDAGYMFFSTWHWLPLVNGYTGHPPRAHYDRMRALAARLPDDEAVDALVAETGLRWIVVHGDERSARDWEVSPRLREAASGGDARVLEVLPKR
jgi:hypothetical protein